MGMQVQKEVTLTVFFLVVMVFALAGIVLGEFTTGLYAAFFADPCNAVPILRAGFADGLIGGLAVGILFGLYLLI
jgi:hypothetical protein